MVDEYEANIDALLYELSQKMSKVYVNIVTLFWIGTMKELVGGRWHCIPMKVFECILLFPNFSEMGNDVQC